MRAKKWLFSLILLNVLLVSLPKIYTLSQGAQALARESAVPVAAPLVVPDKYSLVDRIEKIGSVYQVHLQHWSFSKENGLEIHLQIQQPFSQAEAFLQEVEKMAPGFRIRQIDLQKDSAKTLSSFVLQSNAR